MLWMWRWLWRSMRMRFLVPLLLVGAVGEFWLSVRPKPCPLDERRVRLADEVAAKLAESLPEPPLGRPSIVVLPFERDSTGSITEAVRRAIERVDRYAVQPPSLWENTCRKIGLPVQPVSTDRVESLAMSNIPAEYVLGGRVNTLSARSDMDEATLECVLVPVGAAIEPDDYFLEDAQSARSPSDVQPESTSAAAVRLRAEAVHDHRSEAKRALSGISLPPGPLLVVLLLAATLPLVVAPVITRGLAKESNVVNLAMLLGLTAAAGLACWTLLGLQPETAPGASVLALTLAAAFTYNWWVLSKLEELRN